MQCLIEEKLQKLEKDLPTPSMHLLYFSPFEVQKLAKKYCLDVLSKKHLFTVLKDKLPVKYKAFCLFVGRDNDIAEDEWWNNQINIFQINFPLPFSLK